MSVLRYIDGDGREQVIDDVNHLFDVIKARQIQNNSLVWDEGECRWITARDHEFFRRIREIATALHCEEPSKQFDTAKGSASPAAKDLVEIPASATTAESPASKFKAATESWAAHQARNNKEPSQASREHGYRANVSEKPKARWFKAIKSREEALETIKVASGAFFVVAGIQAIIAVVLIKNFGLDLVYGFLIDAGLYVALASWLRWGRSRLAAVLMLLMALISFGVKTAVMLDLGGNKTWLVSLIVIWAACKAVEATRKLPEFEKASAQEEYQEVALRR
jgi:hypothetical protein